MLVDLTLFGLAIPICILAAWSDLKTMTIPNSLSIIGAAVVVAAVLLLLPFDQALTRIITGLVVLVVGFILFSLGGIGGGDVKLAAALFPLIATSDLIPFTLLLSITTLCAVLTHKIVGSLGMLKPAIANWASWQDQKKFPFGFALSGAFLIYLGLSAMNPA